MVTLVQIDDDLWLCEEIQETGRIDKEPNGDISLVYFSQSKNCPDKHRVET